MRHRKTGRKLNRTDAHRKAMLRNLVCSLLSAEPKEATPRRVTTTIPKAKEARRLAEHAITLGKKGTLHARRQALELLVHKDVVKQLFEDVAPLYAERNGGYTRIVRLTKARVGDGSALCYLELITEAAASHKPAEPVAPKVSREPESHGSERPEGPAADTNAGEGANQQ